MLYVRRLLPALLLCATPLAAQEADVDAFMKRYCLDCHDREARKGEVVLEGLTTRASPRLYKRVLEQLADQTMPPEDEAKRFPNPSEVARVTTSINAALRKVLGDPGRVTLRRLNRSEYNNTVRDLFGVTARPADAFPDDDAGYGFDTIGDVLSLSPVHFERMMKAAEQVASEAVLAHRPALKRVQAERMRKTARGGNHDGWAWFSTNGVADVQIRVAQVGVYVLRARAWASATDTSSRSTPRYSCSLAQRVKCWTKLVNPVPSRRDAPRAHAVGRL